MPVYFVVSLEGQHNMKPVHFVNDHLTLSVVILTWLH